MPIYEYQCAGCGEVFEVFQKLSDPAPKRHSCGSRSIKRVMSRTSFVLKGSGWYLTDYARKGSPQGSDDKSSGSSQSSGAKTDAATAAPEKTTDGKGSEAKTETKKPAKTGAHSASPAHG